MKTCKKGHEYEPGKGCPACIKASITASKQRWLDKRPGYMKKYLADFRKRRPNYQISRKTGTPEADIEDLKQLQNNKCAICFKELITKSTVDHCHTTNKIRGILCYSCNLLLGLAKDNIAILTSAILYIKDAGVNRPDETVRIKNADAAGNPGKSA